MPKKPRQLSVSQTDGEHIFPASQLTPLAIKWKELHAAGRHKDAMLVLEQLVEGSTSMFERLAQYEDFHYTVDLPILVSAAQERVVKWLIKWNPKKGRLFSWFSLHHDTLIALEDGSMRPIGELVRERYSGKVISWNDDQQVFEARHVTGWSEEPSKRKDWRKLMVKRPSGYSNPVYITHEHRVWTQAGWKQVDHLRPNDTLFLDRPTLTPEGEAALVGLYLGDGSVLKDDFRVTHGVDQRFYNDWLRKKFRGEMYECATVGWNTFTESNMDHAGETIMYFHAADAYADYGKFKHPKEITPWVLDRVTPVGLAVWYMDGGSYFSKNGAVTLATMSFTRAERTSLKIMLEQKFGLKVALHKNKSLYLCAESRDAFFNLVAPHMLREFDYKLDEAHRLVSKQDSVYIADRIEQIKHCSAAPAGYSWKVVKRFKVPSAKSKTIRYGAKAESFGFKYDLTVEGNHNFFVGRRKLLVSNSKCAKNAFRSELVKVNTYRKRFHVTSENLERFYGAEDHEVDKHDAAFETHNRLSQIFVRWGDPQEQGALRYLVNCIIDEEHDKQASIRSAAYAYGISFDLAKFFYTQACVKLRHAFHDKVYVPFTREDLERAGLAYEAVADFFDYFPSAAARRYIIDHQGTRVKIPSTACLSRMHDNYALYRELDKSDLDPDSVTEIARRHKRTVRSAQEIFNSMVETLDPHRTGEYGLFDDSANAN